MQSHKRCQNRDSPHVPNSYTRNREEFYCGVGSWLAQTTVNAGIGDAAT